jgi:hypothetical protein
MDGTHIDSETSTGLLAEQLANEGIFITHSQFLSSFGSATVLFFRGLVRERRQRAWKIANAKEELYRRRSAKISRLCPGLQTGRTGCTKKDKLKPSHRRPRANIDAILERAATGIFRPSPPAEDTPGQTGSPGVSDGAARVG